MLSWALTFLIIALIAAVLGFGGIAGSAAWIRASSLWSIYHSVSLVIPFPRPPARRLMGVRDRVTRALWSVVKLKEQKAS